MRRRGKSARSKNTRTVEGAKCPLCGKPVQENEKAFGCTAWREGCRFTLWKDCLTRGGGPTLNAKLAVLILEKGAVRGSSGEIQLREGRISFVPSGAQTPSVSAPIIYKKK